MNRPFIFCHMLTSADGRIHGSYMHTPELKDAEDVFYELAFGRHAFYRPNAWICGRVTTEDMFTEGRELRLDEGSESVPEGDYINPSVYADFYYVALDSRGVIGWDKDFVRIRGEEVLDLGNQGYYWSNMLDNENPRNANTLVFSSEDIKTSSSIRYLGIPVRPVRAAVQ
jgi:hypothetical protein